VGNAAIDAEAQNPDVTHESKFCMTSRNVNVLPAEIYFLATARNVVMHFDKNGEVSRWNSMKYKFQKARIY